jgi:2,3-bisphosphoglycerate-independent phosphoglycerate mutase
MDNSLEFDSETAVLSSPRPSSESPSRPVAPSPPLPLSPSPILLIFIDGVGIGTRGEHNPLDGLESEFFSIFQGEQPRLPFEGAMAETDARLGVDGLPQSATGQTAILTGVNAAKLIGRHLHGYPSPRLKQALAEHSIYKKLIAQGRSVTFANAYTRSYIDNPPRFISATTVAAQTAGVRLRMLEDLQEGHAVSHDFTNRFLIERGFEVDICSPEGAGARLAALAASHDFTLYEHFITDRIGHSRRRDLARDHMLELTRFVRAVLEAADLSRQTVIMTSDHGNIEDLSTRSHTLNPVATLAFGPARSRIASRVRSLTDITPAIVDSLLRKSTEPLAP